jgi:hypothetical protein
MTEQEWQTSSDLYAMLCIARGEAPPMRFSLLALVGLRRRQPTVLPIRQASERKLRLFALACCRRALPTFPDARLSRGLVLAERRADDATVDVQATLSEVNQVYAEICEPYDYERHQPIVGGVRSLLHWEPLETEYGTTLPENNVGSMAIYAAERAADRASVSRWQRQRDKEIREAREREIKAQCDLLRDILGNPYSRRDGPLSIGSAVVQALAQAIYDENAFDRLPILADALEEAGCTDPEILNHCRSEGAAHVRGCWVVDSLLGKE